jgi:hypothetical protein
MFSTGFLDGRYTPLAPEPDISKKGNLCDRNIGLIVRLPPVNVLTRIEVYIDRGYSCGSAF